MEIKETYQKLLSYLEEAKDDKHLFILVRYLTWFCLVVLAYYLVYLVNWKQILNSSFEMPEGIFAILDALFSIVMSSGKLEIFLIYPISLFGFWILDREVPKARSKFERYVYQGIQLVLAIGSLGLIIAISDELWPISIFGLIFFSVAIQGLYDFFYIHESKKASGQVRLYIGPRLLNLGIGVTCIFICSLLVAGTLANDEKAKKRIKQSICNRVHLVSILKTSGKTVNGWLIKNSDKYVTIHRKDTNGIYERLDVSHSVVESVVDYQRFEDPEERTVAFNGCR